jgi:protein-S-isoprenylcysteine O-methyltransferase Ste14
MTETEPAAGPRPPALPAALLAPTPVIVVIAVAWLVAVALAFTVPGLESWRPVSIAGLGVGVLGTSIFLVQRRAVRRGSRGAQSGL